MSQILRRVEKEPPSEDSVEQMLELAERVRASNGGDLDESALQAVAEATGAPIEYVRLAVKLRAEREQKSIISSVRAQLTTMDHLTRRLVTSGLIATGCALLQDLSMRFDDGGSTQYGIFSMLSLILAAVGMYNVAISRDSKIAALSGAVLGGGYFLMTSVFGFVLGLQMRVEPSLLIPFAVAGAVFGLGLQKFVSRNGEKWGLKDPIRERQDLLRQLHDLREKLHSGEQSLAFLSVDIVGSTRMKQQADPLAVEFTFNEYQHFVERVASRHAGRVHSTAGDGVICVFENPRDAFAAAKNVQTGLLELNTFRNKIGTPIVVRCGVHSGTVVTADAADVTSVEFAEVIDLASHLQKAAPPGGIAVSELAAQGIPGGLAAVGSERCEVSGIRGGIWMPRAHATASQAAPPAIPESA